jgi:hypothetical protein
LLTAKVLDAVAWLKLVVVLDAVAWLKLVVLDAVAWLKLVVRAAPAVAVMLTSAIGHDDAAKEA